MSSTYIVTPNLTANGNILPSVFVKIDTSTNYACIQSTANDRTIGVSWDGTRDAPGTNGASAYAYVQGDAATIFGPGAVCLLAVGSGGWTAGDLLESDANGAGITSSSSGHNVGAVALEAGSQGEYRHVFVTFSNHP